MNVDHQPAEHRFRLSHPGGSGELVYRPRGEKVLDLRHTEVDPSLRGTGAAEALVRAAFEYARNEGYRIIPSCPYVRRWLDRNPDQMDLVSR